MKHAVFALNTSNSRCPMAAGVRALLHPRFV